MLARDLETHGQAVGVGAADAPALVASPLHKAGFVANAVSVALQIGFAFHSPDHFAQGRPLLDGRRQVGMPIGRHDDAAAVEAFEHQAVRRFLHQLQPPVEEKAAAGGEVVHAVGDFVDTQYAHGDSSQFAQGKGLAFRPQYMLFCSMYCWMPRRPFSRPRPLSFQPPNGVEIENCL